MWTLLFIEYSTCAAQLDRSGHMSSTFLTQFNRPGHVSSTFLTQFDRSGYVSSTINGNSSLSLRSLSKQHCGPPLEGVS